MSDMRPSCRVAHKDPIEIRKPAIVIRSSVSASLDKTDAYRTSVSIQSDRFAQFAVFCSSLPEPHILASTSVHLLCLK